MESSPNGEWSTHITVKVSPFIFLARLIQTILGFGGCAFAATMLVWTPRNMGNYWYIYTPAWALVPVVTVMAMITLMGAVGMFAYKRPNDVHWHLMLALDWLTFSLALGGFVLAIMASFAADGRTLGVYVAMDICICAVLLAILLPIIRTHRLKKRRALPPPNTRKQTWYYMEDECRRSIDSSPYPSYAPPLPPPSPSSPRPVRREPSQANSRADTMARWSGISGSTTAYPTVAGGSEAPSYSGPISPARSVAKQ